MRILLENIGRRFNREWIFRGVSQTFTENNAYAVLGPNGSGKSTLLQVIAGSLTPSEGRLAFTTHDKVVEADSVFQHLSVVAPYLELIEEFTLFELLQFHFRFKSIMDNQSIEELISLMHLEKARNKQIKYFSSGMKQRLKLGLAICSKTELLILDEPTSNLDKDGIEWYHKMTSDFINGRIVIIGSNVEHEYGFCNNFIHITDYK